MTLFDRRVSVTVGSRKFEGDKIDAGTFVRGFHLAFKVSQALTAEDNSAEVEIHGLAHFSRTALQSFTNPTFVIEAGYHAEVGAVFKGVAQSVLDTRALPGIVTKISASDGSKEGKKIINLTLGPDSKMKDAIRAFASAMGANASRAIQQATQGQFNRAFDTFLNGITFSGSSKHELSKLMQSAGLQWSIVNGELVILNPEETTTEAAVQLSPSEGLVGSPVRIIDQKRPKDLLYKVRSLLQANLRPGRRVVLEAADVRGHFRVEKSEHSGDTAGGDWYSDVTLKRISPA